MELEKEKARSILHVTVGIPGQWEPTAEELEDIKNLFESTLDDPKGTVVATRTGIDARVLPIQGEPTVDVIRKTVTKPEHEKFEIYLVGTCGGVAFWSDDAEVSYCSSYETAWTILRETDPASIDDTVKVLAQMFPCVCLKPKLDQRMLKAYEEKANVTRWYKITFA